MSERVALQMDIRNLPSNILSTTGLAQTLLEVISTDNASPVAVLQTQSLGAYFHSNGPWAARLPDLLIRTSSVLLERLSA